jgi:U1 small nuclear ribonucleoprotein 70kDa
MLEYI